MTLRQEDCKTPLKILETEELVRKFKSLYHLKQFKLSISHSVNSKFVRTVRAAAEAGIHVETKTHRLYRNVGLEQNLEVKNLRDFHKQKTSLGVYLLFHCLTCFFFPSVCLHNLSPLYPLCFPFLTVVITSHLLPNPSRHCSTSPLAFSLSHP